LSLPAGTRLGVYEILGPLGAGGMGEVYRAKDTRLERTVALKVLPEEFFEDKDRVARFEREGKLLATLNHPNIAAIYSFEEIPGSPSSPGSSGRHILVMELLEGETLRERLRAGPLASRRAIDVTVQMAQALAAAHEKGIVHRDLKPENVFLTKDDRVKLLDFGLAKLSPQARTEEGLTSAGTRSLLTEAGVMFGTVGYMSPEQVRGEPADNRSDIFSFGTILYELLAGKNPFRAATSPETMTAILRHEPSPLSEPPLAVAPALSQIVARCLEKKREARFQSAADLAFALESVSAAGTQTGIAPAASSPRRRPALTIALAFVAGAAIAGAIGWAWTRKAARPPSPRAVRLSVPPPANGQFVQTRETTFLAMSPDGAHVAYVAFDPMGGRRVWLRTLSTLEARPLAGTEGARSVFWSPDGASLAFFAEEKLKRLELPAGAPLVICDVAGSTGKSGTWGHDGDILFTSIQGEAIYRVSASGGTPVVERRPDSSRDETRVSWPWFLPDGERFLYVLRERATDHLVLSAPGQPARVLMPVASRVQYADPGYLVFAREGALVAQRFDWRNGSLAGGPFSIAEHVNYFHPNGNAAFATSRTGTLAYQPREDVQRLAFFDRTGREAGAVGAHGNYISLAIAPDVRRMLFDRQRPETSTLEVWSLDLERNVETRVSSGPYSAALPLWLPGGGQIVYSVTRYGPPSLVRRDLATGKEEELLTNRAFHVAHAVSPDGATLVYGERTDRGAFDLWTLPLAGGGKPAPLIQSLANKSEARFSPDGRFIAFLSDESGRSEVYVTPFPVPGERVRVSTGGARLLRWSRGGELLFLSSDLRMTSVPIRTSPSLQLGAPATLFALKGDAWRSFDVSPDGKRFLAIVPEVEADQLPLTVVVNWTSEVEK